jgi:hypothetical protein
LPVARFPDLSVWGVREKDITHLPVGVPNRKVVLGMGIPNERHCGTAIPVFGTDDYYSMRRQGTSKVAVGVAVAPESVRKDDRWPPG